jgi:hypothetical protein
MIIAESQAELELVLEELDKLKSAGLELNIKKSQIMSNRKDMVGVTQVKGILVTDSIKYLGIELYCDRDKTIKSIKSQIQKFICFIRGKIRSESISTLTVIFSAYHRSLMLYFLTPLYAAGAITQKEICNIEANLKKSIYGLKGDLSHELV